MSDCKNKKKCLDCEQGLTTKPPINTIPCEDSNPCSTSTLSQCVIYNGIELTCNDVVISESGDNLNVVLASFLELICSSTSNVTINEVLCSEGTVITEGSTIQEAFEQVVSFTCSQLLITEDRYCGEDLVYTALQSIRQALDSTVSYFCERLENINLNLIIDTTYSELQDLIENSTLEKGKFYHNADNGVILQALETNIISTTGTRVMRIVKNLYYTPDTGILGVWNASLTPTIGDVAIWGGKVWENTTGNVGTFTDDATLDPTDWVLIPTINDTYYFTKSFGCTYDITNNWVASQWDDRGNVFTFSYDANSYDFVFSYNLIDISDWGNKTIFENKCMGVFNNTSTYVINNHCIVGYISNNVTTSDISYNFTRGGIISNECLGINSNKVTSISLCTNNGVITHNVNNGIISNIGSTTTDIIYNTNNGNITTTVVGAITDPIVNK